MPGRSYQCSRCISDRHWRFEPMNPPGWAHRDELWTIDELLGLYEPHQRMITIFTKGIGHVAGQLGVQTFSVEYLVRVHEYAHAVFHLGVDQSPSASLAKAFLD